MEELNKLNYKIKVLQELEDNGTIPLFAEGMLQAYKEVQPLVKKLTIPVVVKSFYCDDADERLTKCKKQCKDCLKLNK